MFFHFLCFSLFLLTVGQLYSEYNFIKNDTINVKQRENKQYYIEIIKTENNPFEEFYAFYKTGKLKNSIKALFYVFLQIHHN